MNRQKLARTLAEEGLTKVAGGDSLQFFEKNRRPENTADSAEAMRRFLKSEGGKSSKILGLYQFKGAERIWAVKFEWELPRYGPRVTILKNVPGDPERIERWGLYKDNTWGYQGTIRSSWGNWTL